MAAPGRQEGSVLAGFLWMLILGLALFWLPFFGPLIAGFVGGRAAGSPGRGFEAAILPAIIVAIVVVIASFFFLVPGIGLLTGVSVLIVAIIQFAPMIIGALVGGATVS
jgi:hypothetical protein